MPWLETPAELERSRAEQPVTLPADGFVERFRPLVQRGAQALFVYGDADAEYVASQLSLQTVFSRLPPAGRARFEVELWPGDVHGYLDVPLQRRALERVPGWQDRFLPPSVSPPRANGAAA